MRPWRIGALFAGYGGLDLGVADVIDAEVAWFAEVNDDAARIMAHHHPDAPNIGDVTRARWDELPPVDVITGGSPCQDLSPAGKRAGMKPGTRSGLWASMCDAIETIRPQLVVWENVRGALSAEADSAVEPCPICVGDASGVTLRALGRVLGDLAELGYDAWWYGLRASDVDAPHERFRIFVFAVPTADAGRVTGEVPPSRRQPTVPQPAGHGHQGRAGMKLLPTPEAKLGASGPDYARALRVGSGCDDLTTTVHKLTDALAWGEYAEAIELWESRTRPAPAATEPSGRRGGARLSPAFVEWMMGLPAGWVSDPAIGISHNARLKALGNGVCPQQAAAATRQFTRDAWGWP